ncbi:MAG: molybdate ABC transporter substrate-binding protein [Telmatospirillum sp.]|nr:molybdate ABC transporter substrate-binding protein [Telmatospirillum sp.]
MKRVLLIAVALLGLGLPAQAQAPLIYAAASLTDALQEAVTATGNTARFSFAASSTLARQIENGAPADIFASADEEWADYLQQRGKLVTDTRRSYLSNRLVVLAPADQTTPLALETPGAFAARLGNGRIATGDPAHVPVGRYAQQALTALGLWTLAEPRLARAESVRAAVALVERGEVPLGIVYATDAAAAPRVARVATFPAASHARISYPFALVAGRDTAANRRLLEALQSPAALAVFARHGFAVD